MQGTTVSELREAEAWRGFLRAHSTLVDELDRELTVTHGLPLHEFEVLLLLHGAPEGRLRMSELADRALLSQSGLTRLVDRLERAGCVERVRCAADRRGLYAVITPDPGQVEALATVWEALLGADAGRDCSA